ncbi:MalM family protein [Marinobacter confluentis]|uniref:DUF4124 domain-containing protein n=1 Tax=Marinobacter confluentis TaxID=1697557 RepID=A0A4Z1BN38_9GAMM|nr:MalM family protein [Marinobacter confluentis]TGN41397.1 hypothetical protein E5Q11_02330 [Marinobacter confluentis]
MNRGFLIVSLLAAMLSGCQMPGGEPSGARDGYFTWVDEQGQVRQTPIPGSKSPDQDDRAEQSSGSWSRASSGNPSDASEESSGSGTHPEFNLENFPDGNALEERGYVRPGDPEPYFTWRDAQGNVRVSYYQPDTRTAVEKGEIEPPLELTGASIYQSVREGKMGGAARDPENARLPEGADPLAAAVLGLEESEAPFFERWSEACCETLDRSDYLEWEPGREFGINLRQTSASHPFITGESHYRLVELPQGAGVEDFILRLRSFDQKGLFVPSVAFLNGEFEPLRLITNLAAEFVPESWSQHGFLRAYIPVFPSRGERWLLVYTTADDIEGQTVIDTRYGPRAIKHQPTGELGLMKVEQ